MLSRDRQPMPSFVKAELINRDLLSDYRNRPGYQQNDYLMWINSAKTEATKQKRLNQMLEELKVGGVYMKMDHPASKKTK